MFGWVATDTQLYTNTLAIMGFTSIPTMIVILIISHITQVHNIVCCIPIQVVIQVYRIYIYGVNF